MTIPGIPVSKAIELGQLATEVGIPNLGISTDTDGSKILHTYDGQGVPSDFAPGVRPAVVTAVAAHTPPAPISLGAHINDVRTRQQIQTAINGLNNYLDIATPTAGNTTQAVQGMAKIMLRLLERLV